MHQAGPSKPIHADVSSFMFNIYQPRVAALQ